MPDRIIPERGQGSENGIQPSTKQRADVLQDDDCGCQFANKAGDLVEQPTSFAGQPQTSASDTNVLAGKAPRDDIDGNSIGRKSLCGKGADVIIAGDVRPVLGEDFARERFDFAEGDGFKPACSFKAKAKPSDTREKIKDAQLFHSPRPRVISDIAHLPAHQWADKAVQRAQVSGADKGLGERHAAGHSRPLTCAASLRCSSLECGMPILRQLCTVLTGAPIIRATAVVPPSASRRCVSFAMTATMRLSHHDCKPYFCICAVRATHVSADNAILPFALFCQFRNLG